MRDRAARPWTGRGRQTLAALRTLVAFLILLSAATAGARADASADKAAVMTALQDSAAAWSRGDLNGFMQCYEASPDTLYIGAHGLVRGADAIRATYAAHYGQGAAMGHLSLTVLDYRPLGTGFALLTGRFALQKPGSSAAPATGIFTLVFHKSPSGWHIIADHTSS